MKYRELTPEEIKIYQLGYRVGNHQTVITDIEWTEEEKAIYRKGYLAGAKAFNRTGQPTEPIVSTMSTMSTMSTPRTSNYNYNNNNNNNNTEIKDSNKGVIGGKEKGKKPTLEEVLEYAKMQNSIAGMGGFPCTDEQAEDFFDHYAAQGWIAGNGIPIHNWKPKLREWARERYKPKQKKQNDDESRGI